MWKFIGYLFIVLVALLIWHRIAEDRYERRYYLRDRDSDEGPWL